MTKILFMGTPEFASAQLRAIFEAAEENDFQIVGVLCQPDKPKGRGYKMIPPPVKEYALSVGLPVYQPTTLRDEAFAALLSELDPDLIVVAAYGKILPVNVLDYPKYGCINVHGSLLPAYRGAAPIQRAIMDGLSGTGVTIMHMAAGLDTGDMIDSVRVPISENEDFGTLYAEMGEAGARLLLSVIPRLTDGTAPRIPQDDALSNYAAKIEKEECRLSFDTPVRILHNKIRALSPSPLAFALLSHAGEEKTVKFVSSVVLSEETPDAAPGTVLSLDAKKNLISVACPDGVLGVTALVPEGKGKMTAGDFIRGRKIDAGDMFH